MTDVENSEIISVENSEITPHVEKITNIRFAFDDCADGADNPYNADADVLQSQFGIFPQSL